MEDFLYGGQNAFMEFLNFFKFILIPSDFDNIFIDILTILLWISLLLFLFLIFILSKKLFLWIAELIYKLTLKFDKEEQTLLIKNKHFEQGSTTLMPIYQADGSISMVQNIVEDSANVILFSQKYNQEFTVNDVKLYKSHEIGGTIRVNLAIGRNNQNKIKRIVIKSYEV